MSKTPEEMVKEFADSRYMTMLLASSTNAQSLVQKVFLAGYKAAEDKYEARIKELETKLENSQHDAIHGNKGL
jgi:hypothetical protein